MGWRALKPRVERIFLGPALTIGSGEVAATGIDTEGRKHPLLRDGAGSESPLIS
jgi:hypothetical protein